MSGLTENIHLLTPEFALAGLAALIFIIDLFLPEDRKDWAGWLSILGLAGLIVLSIAMLSNQEATLYGGLLAVDAFGLFFKVFFMAIAIAIIISSLQFVRRFLGGSQGEYYALVLLATLGMNIMAMARELLTAYIALELLSFCLYVLAAYARGDSRSNEAGLKYIIVGAFSSAILLYGLSMIYSTLGVTKFAEIAAALSSIEQVSPALWVGLAFILVGLGFKLSAVPFHAWAPDVYQGAPLPVTAFLAIASKSAAFALLLRLVAEAFVPAADYWAAWQWVLAILAAATMLVGNLVALAQHNIKRLLAYSSIGHVGFALAGITAISDGSALAASGVTFYLVGYAVTSFVVFTAAIAFFNVTGQDDIADLGGLADRHPFLAATLAIGLFSLAGLPIFAGFTAKFFLFTAIAAGGFLWLAGLAMVASLISLYYYLQVIRRMYIEPAPGAAPIDELHAHGHEAAAPEPATRRGGIAANRVAPLVPSRLLMLALTLGLAGVFWLGVYPGPVMDSIEAASRAILPGL